MVIIGTGGNAFSKNNSYEVLNRTTITNSQKKTIKAGLLIPGEHQLAAKHGAELALRKAIKEGGFDGIHFELIVKPTSGPWGTSSKKSVSLVFDDEVLVIMGSLDSRNAHLAEQVAAKTKLVYLSAWATDMSLSYAYVPWYFRVVPNDKQQAAALIEEISFNRNYKKVAVIGTDENDSRLAVSAYIEEAKKKNTEPPVQYTVSTSEKNPLFILSDIEHENYEAIVLIGDNKFASKIIPALKKHQNNVPLFATLSVTDNQQANIINWSLLENVTMIASDFWFTENGIGFQKEFKKEFGYEPGPAAAYAFDGMNVIIKAVKMSNLALTDVLEDRDQLINAFSKMNYKNGVTGDIEFDKSGNRMINVKLMRVINNKPVPF